MVIILRGSGASYAVGALHNFFSLQRMFPCRSIGPRTEEELANERGFGVIARADKRGDVRDSRRAIREAQALGKSMVETIQVLGKSRT